MQFLGYFISINKNLTPDWKKAFDHIQQLPEKDLIAAANIVGLNTQYLTDFSHLPGEDQKKHKLFHEESLLRLRNIVSEWIHSIKYAWEGKDHCFVLFEKGKNKILMTGDQIETNENYHDVELNNQITAAPAGARKLILFEKSGAAAVAGFEIFS